MFSILPVKALKTRCFQIRMLRTTKILVGMTDAGAHCRKSFLCQIQKANSCSLKFRERTSQREAPGRRKTSCKLHHITFYDTKWDVGNVISLTWFIVQAMQMQSHWLRSKTKEGISLLQPVQLDMQKSQNILSAAEQIETIISHLDGNNQGGWNAFCCGGCCGGINWIVQHLSSHSLWYMQTHAQRLIPPNLS